VRTTLSKVERSIREIRVQIARHKDCFNRGSVSFSTLVRRKGERAWDRGRDWLFAQQRVARNSGYGAYDTRGREGSLNTLGRIMWLTKSFFAITTGILARSLANFHCQ